MYVIIKSNKKHQPNWSGKEFSQNACKIYSGYDVASDAIIHYWYGGYNLGTFDHRQIVFVPLTEKKMIKLIDQKKARY